ncbi:hypothetical protein KEG38_20460 [Polyangium jinanense]|uniref:hypothetical protein n=1 Tax=Polyangium jinanense TaxID=2829994 RepID=UPI00234219C8|nr:hypothetical protein [Polyangium jinanense]MDC3956246.1 hypothetical protein [Polyangium jinanense]
MDRRGWVLNRRGAAPAPPEGGGLGQVVKLPDGKLVMTRFGHGRAGDVVYANPVTSRS